MKGCYKTSNNKYFDCPPRMADGRHFTDYRPNCYVNNLLRANNRVKNSFEFRQFLTDNADSLMEMNRAYACQKNCCGPCKEPFSSGTMLPEQSTVKCNSETCTQVLNDPKGLGQGRDYGFKDKCPKWPKKFPVNQPSNCCSNSKNLFDYYDSVETEAQGNLHRFTSPSGGIALSGGDPKAYNS